jgi:hypothetical protein
MIARRLDPRAGSGVLKCALAIALLTAGCTKPAGKSAPSACQFDAQCTDSLGKGSFCFLGTCRREHESLLVQLEAQPPVSSGLPPHQYPPVDLQHIGGAQDLEIVPRRIAGYVQDARGGHALPARVVLESKVATIEGRPLRFDEESDPANSPTPGLIDLLIPDGPYSLTAILADGLRAAPTDTGPTDSGAFPVGTHLTAVAGTVTAASPGVLKCLQARVVSCKPRPGFAVRCGRDAVPITGPADVSEADGAYALQYDQSYTGAQLHLEVAPSPDPSCAALVGPTVYRALGGNLGDFDLDYGTYPAPTLVRVRPAVEGVFLPGAQLSIAATTLDGAPAASEVTYQAQGLAPPGGEIALYLPRGEHQLLVAGPAGSTLRHHRQPLTVAAQSISLDLPLLALPTLRGQVIRREDGRPVAGVAVSAQGADDELVPTLPLRTAQATTDAEGRFALRLEPSSTSYRIFFEAPPVLKLPSWSVVLEQMPSGDLDLPAPVELPFAQALSGTVSGGAPGMIPTQLGEVRVDVYWVAPPVGAREAEAILIGTGITDDEGNFQILLPKTTQGAE